jgi:hypothetical protein
MALPELMVENVRYDALERRYIMVLPAHGPVQFETWEELRAHYREQARLLRSEVFHARFFVFGDTGWTEVHPPSFGN